MSVLDASYYRTGDLVTAYFDELWVPGRVVGYAERTDWDLFGLRSARWSEQFDAGNYLIAPRRSKTNGLRIKVAFNLPDDYPFARFRIIPADTSVFWTFQPDKIRLETHDPDWNPFAFKPTSDPDTSRVRGTYMNTKSYDANDPVWVWEDHGWRAASVVDRTERWVSVRYHNQFHDRRGNRAKSYRTYQIWPVISERSSLFEAKLARWLEREADRKSQAPLRVNSSL